MPWPRLRRDYHAHPLVLVKLLICKLRLADVVGLMEFCHRCGRHVRNVWWTHPELWYEVVGVGYAGIRCLDCFDCECQERGILIVWHPRVETRRGEDGEWKPVPPPDPEFYPVAARLYREQEARC